MKSPPAQGAKFKRLYLSRGTKQKEAAIQVGKTQRMEGFEPLSFKALWDRKNGNFDSRSTANTTVFLLLDIENWKWLNERKRPIYDMFARMFNKTLQVLVLFLQGQKPA